MGDVQIARRANQEKDDDVEVFEFEKKGKAELPSQLVKHAFVLSKEDGAKKKGGFLSLDDKQKSERKTKSKSKGGKCNDAPIVLALPKVRTLQEYPSVSLAFFPFSSPSLPLQLSSNY